MLTNYPVPRLSSSDLKIIQNGANADGFCLVKVGFRDKGHKNVSFILRQQAIE